MCNYRFVAVTTVNLQELGTCSFFDKQWFICNDSFLTVAINTHKSCWCHWFTCIHRLFPVSAVKLQELAHLTPRLTGLVLSFQHWTASAACETKVTCHPTWRVTVRMAAWIRVVTSSTAPCRSCRGWRSMSWGRRTRWRSVMVSFMVVCRGAVYVGRRRTRWSWVMTSLMVLCGWGWGILGKRTRWKPVATLWTGLCRDCRAGLSVSLGRREVRYCPLPLECGCTVILMHTHMHIYMYIHAHAYTHTH